MVVKELLPIKLHYFFFMAAMGPILPQISVYGKELGISPLVMGSITGVLPITFLIAKPLFGVLFDVFKNHRKYIFMGLILMMTGSFALIYFVPAKNLMRYQFDRDVDTCNVTLNEDDCNLNNTTVEMICSCQPNNSLEIKISGLLQNADKTEQTFCVLEDSKIHQNFTDNCQFDCIENLDASNQCFYATWNFWVFVILLSMGSIGFNVANSISDAVCFAVIGQEYDYGKQRLWGTIGFGITALISGYVVDLVSDGMFSYTPAFILMLIFTVFDFISCSQLDLSVMESPKNIFKDIKNLINNAHTIIFIIFAILSGIVDGFIVYFLFWYLEDLAVVSKTSNIKLIEGLIVAAETLGGEVLFFSISGKILERVGHIMTFSLCFVFYALRLILISFISSPWWALPIEFCMQGPTYALTYTTIVEYANAIAPKGATATMQGIAAGMDDGFGYAIGSALGGFLYRYLGGAIAFQIFAIIALTCGIVHLVLHKTVLRGTFQSSDYKSPAEAMPLQA